ncbi:MAG TPA: formate dehydrogenase accessory protein FdhE [Longimicrobiales bacterium]
MADLNPEWRAWLALVETTLDALEDPAWGTAAPDAPAPARPAAAPLLHGTTIRVDARRARRWVRRLVKTAADESAPGAASLRRFRFRRLDAAALLEAAVAHDTPRIEQIAAEVDADPHALAAVAQLAARPLLQASGRRLAGHVPPGWDHGYCPVCGAWPALAESRGIERARRLRCARCGADWNIVVLRCPFCGERDHRRQGGLVPDGEEEIRRVDTCHSCRGYVKTITTLRPIAPPAVLIEDLATVELDIAALERGYARPERPGYTVVVSVGDGARGPAVRSGAEA